MIDAIALLDGFDDDGAVVAWRRGLPITRARFLSDVAALAERLPDRGHVLNVATDRYRFAVGLAAAIVRGQISLLPPSTLPGIVVQLRSRFPDVYCLADSARVDIDLPQVLAEESDTGSVITMPMVPTDRTIAYVFTSGSTGTPTLHRKRWGSLVVNVRSEAERLGCDRRTRERPFAIVATVPPQHMYGFESSLLMAWQSGNALVAERPFFPADIVASLAALPAPRMLVTTPFHLRTLLAEEGPLPPLETIVCATAPLSDALAADAERRCAAPVLEIYGCTETGQLASRRPTVDPCWRPFGDVELDIVDGRATARGGHIDEPTVLGDSLEAASDFATTRRFRLGGRSVDLVNIAGKRTSLGHLNLQINAIDGVLDGVFVLPDDADTVADGVARLTAIVVAPTLDSERLVAALRTRIEAVFLPRSIHFVDRIPRNETGKVTLASVQEMLAALAPKVDRGSNGGMHR